MDFHKPRDTPMSRRRRIYEGKAKVLYEGPEPGTLIQHFKDDATAFNAKKHEVIEGKGVLNNRISEYVFQHLNDIGVPTHFIRRLNMREQLIREVEIIPLEIVVRNVAAGSLAQRLGIEEGTQLPRSIIEFYYKNDKLNDPMVSEEHVTAFGWATPQEIDDIMALAIRVNDFLSGLFLGVGIRLVDFKMETGRLWENDLMRIVVADEISPDSCRLWDIKSSEKLDKDRFRRDLGGLLEAYTEGARRLGIMSEGERPQGSGPVLVKGWRARKGRCDAAARVADNARGRRHRRPLSCRGHGGRAAGAQDLSDQAGAHRGALRRRRRHRCARALPRAGAREAPGPALHHREPAGAGDRHRRRLFRARGGRRLLAARGYQFDLGDQSRRLPQASLRSADGFLADLARGGGAVRAGGESVVAGSLRRRARRARQIEAGRAQLCLGRDGRA